MKGIWVLFHMRYCSLIYSKASEVKYFDKQGNQSLRKIIKIPRRPSCYLRWKSIIQGRCRAPIVGIVRQETRRIIIYSRPWFRRVLKNTNLFIRKPRFRSSITGWRDLCATVKLVRWVLRMRNNWWAVSKPPKSLSLSIETMLWSQLESLSWIAER